MSKKGDSHIFKRMNLLSGSIDENGFPGSPNSPKQIRYNLHGLGTDIEAEYIADIRPMYDVVKDKKVLEIAVGSNARLTSIYNHYGIKSLFGIEPYKRWFNQSKEILEILAEFDWELECLSYEDYKPGEFDVVVCNGLAYHLHSPYHLFEYLANINAEYIIMETTGVPNNGNTDDTLERIHSTMLNNKESFEDYLMGKSKTISRFEEQNIPGNSISSGKRKIPWSHTGMNPDIRVLAFWCMGYDLDASNERIGGMDRSKVGTTTYRFKRSNKITRDPRLLGQQ